MTFEEDQGLISIECFRKVAVTACKEPRILCVAFSQEDIEQVIADPPFRFVLDVVAEIYDLHVASVRHGGNSWNSWNSWNS